MGREERREIISKLEELRESRLVVYFGGDRPLVSSQIADDAIRPMYDHLLDIVGEATKIDKLDFFVYSLGGAMETPWKIVSMLREFCNELHIIIPYKAYSATTLLALGADKIWMTRKAELGPVDPSLSFEFSPDRPPPFLLRSLAVEDVASYVKFMRDRAGLTDQTALAGAMGTLAEKLTPPLLGRIERIYNHIRLVARKLLALSHPPLEDAKVDTIVETLTEKTYVHGHGIGRKEAKDIGLRIEELTAEEEALVWALYLDFEETLNLGTSMDPNQYFTKTGPDFYEESKVQTAYIESANLCHAFVGDFHLERHRKVPPNPALNLNLNLSLPPGLDPAQLPGDVQGALQQIMQMIQQQLPAMIAGEIARQSPIEGIGGGLRGGRWMPLT